MKLVVVAAMGFALFASAHAGLVGTEVSLRTLAQSTSTSAPAITSFDSSVVVSDTAIEYPNVANLSNPAVPRPPGFANGLVNTTIDIGDDFIPEHHRMLQCVRLGRAGEQLSRTCPGQFEAVAREHRPH
mgnify:CR=1 FL=1